jgi:hypothetical protein
LSFQTTYTSTESTNRNQTGSTTIAGLTSVNSITVNTGTVTYTINGSTINMTFSGGAVERTTSSQYSYDCSATPSPKYISTSYSGTRANYQRWEGASGWVFDHSTGDAPSSVQYNDGNYAGTLGNNGTSYAAPYYYPTPSNPTVGQIWHNSDTNWTATYSNSLNAIPKTCTGTSYTYWYQYVATINYETNRPPNAPTIVNVKSSGSTINKRPKLFVNVTDPDTLSVISNVEIQIATDSGFTNIIQDIQKGSDSGFGQSMIGWNGLPTLNQSATISWTPQSDLSLGAFFIRARSKDNSGAWSGWSAGQQFAIAAAPWSDTIPVDAFGFKSQWLNDLATVINNSRQFRGVSIFTFTDGIINNTKDIKTVHISERRTSLNDALSISGIIPTWMDSSLDNTIDRKGQHIIDLRNYCAQI